MRRIKLIVGVVALLSVLLAMTAAPAIAHNDSRDHHHDGDRIVDVDFEVFGPFLADDEICWVLVTTEEQRNGDEDVDVDDECVDLGDVTLVSGF